MSEITDITAELKARGITVNEMDSMFKALPVMMRLGLMPREMMGGLKRWKEKWERYKTELARRRVQ